MPNGLEKGGSDMDEALFKRLLFVGEDDENIEELFNLGYLKKIDGVVCKTEKYQKDTGDFIDSKKESLYAAIKKLGSAEDMQKTMEIAGIKDFITFIFIAEELVADGKLAKDKVKNCVLK